LKRAAALLESDPSVFSGTLEIQLQTLIVNPLLQAQQQSLGYMPTGAQAADDGHV